MSASSVAVPHAAVAQELIDSATTELDSGRANARRFAEQLLDEPRIPVEQSAVAWASLSQLLALVPDHAGAVVGAWPGSPDNPPLLLITVATGIVISVPLPVSQARSIPACARRSSDGMACPIRCSNSGRPNERCDARDGSNAERFALRRLLTGASAARH